MFAWFSTDFHKILAFYEFPKIQELSKIYERYDLVISYRLYHLENIKRKKNIVKEKK